MTYSQLCDSLDQIINELQDMIKTNKVNRVYKNIYGKNHRAKDLRTRLIFIKKNDLAMNALLDGYIKIEDVIEFTSTDALRNLFSAKKFTPLVQDPNEIRRMKAIYSGHAGSNLCNLEKALKNLKNESQPDETNVSPYIADEYKQDEISVANNLIEMHSMHASYPDLHKKEKLQNQLDNLKHQLEHIKQCMLETQLNFDASIVLNDQDYDHAWNMAFNIASFQDFQILDGFQIDVMQIIHTHNAAMDIYLKIIQSQKLARDEMILTYQHQMREYELAEKECQALIYQIEQEMGDSLCPEPITRQTQTRFNLFSPFTNYGQKNDNSCVGPDIQTVERHDSDAPASRGADPDEFFSNSLKL